MKIIKTKFEGLFIVKQKRNQDRRGFLRETFNNKILKKKFCFEYFTYSKKNVLRGFHFQINKPQSKYVNVLKGKILDCVVDLRKKSKTFGKQFKTILSEKNCRSIFIPEGFAHGFSCFGKENIVIYSCTNYRNPSGERGILWNDKTLNINWRIKSPIISEKDKKNLNFKDQF